jgi:hypothetical protein
MFKLRTKPTQFTKGKTEETLCDFTKRYLLNNNRDEYHLLEIVVTNKSLPETEQWKIRANNKFKDFEDITIDILSSKSKDYKDIDKYIVKIMKCKNKKELPNILILCYHNKRVSEDLFELFKAFDGNGYVQTTNKIKFHISFDEPDANLGTTKTFLEMIEPYIKQNIIEGILFITATPFDDFWKVMSDKCIHKLLNMNHENIDMFDDSLQEYMSFKEHNIILHENDTLNPLYFVIDLFAKNKINMNRKIILFVPSHLHKATQNKGSHNEFVSYFIDKKFCVLLMNSDFKGFIYPNDTRISLEEFNKIHGIQGELRDTLRKWNEINNCNLAITGYWVIERGITFNTNGFNFTDIILSNYHLSALNRLIQIAGRATGNKKYVKTMNIFCTPEVKEAVIQFNENLEKICSLNPEYFNKMDFSSSKTAIPIRVVFDDVNYAQEIFDICETRKGYKEQLHEMIIQGIQTGKIVLFDNNNINKFDISKRKLKNVRLYKLGHVVKSRRFENFHKAFNTHTGMSQSCNEEQYNIDMAKDTYKLGDFVNSTNIAWITFKV